MNSFLLKKSVFILFFGLMAGPVQAQLYTDTEGRQWVQQALDQLYNFRFEADAAPNCTFQTLDHCQKAFQSK